MANLKPFNGGDKNRQFKNKNFGPRKNERIRAPKIRVIGSDGKQLGIMTPYEALSIARKSGLDLLEVSPNAEPPVCRILDYGKYMYEEAKKVLKERQISKYVLAGSVSAAILSGSGKIYTGVCIDTCSTLGICAERNAIFNMITNGEHEIKKVIALIQEADKLIEGGAPCGACRELMVQLMPEKYKDIEIMLDYNANKIMKLGELTPQWWI